MKVINMEWLHYKEDINNLNYFINLIKERSRHLGILQGQIVNKTDKYDTIFVPNKMYKFSINDDTLSKLKICFVLSISKPDSFNTTILLFSDNDNILHNKQYIEFMEKKEKFTFVKQIINPLLYLELFIYDEIRIDTANYIHRFNKRIDIWISNDRSTFIQYIRGEVDLNYIEFVYSMNKEQIEFYIYSKIYNNLINNDGVIGYFYSYSIYHNINPTKEIITI